MRVIALTFGNETAASSYYRIYQYRTPLAELGIQLDVEPAATFSRWDEICGFDIVIIQKKLMAATRLLAIRRAARHLVYDLDDAIWEPHDKPHHWLTRWRTRRRLRRVASLADCCIAANGVLAAELRRYSRRVEVIPMALDETVWHPVATKAPGPVRVGWAGAPANLPYLKIIEPPLLRLQGAHPEVELVFYCGRAPDFTGGLKITHLPFQPGAEPQAVRSFDIGLLPLRNNAFAHGKSPIKGLQYMACGVATVASPFGATREMHAATKTALFAETETEWTTALLSLVEDAAARNRIGREAGAQFRSCYARSKVVRELAGLLQSFPSKPGCSSNPGPPQWGGRNPDHPSTIPAPRLISVEQPHTEAKSCRGEE